MAGGFRYASELVRFVRENDYGFCLGGACYPEGHIENPSREVDLKNLKAFGEKRLKEIEGFFIAYNRERGKKFKVLAVRGPKQAEGLAREAMRKKK